MARLNARTWLAALAVAGTITAAVAVRAANPPDFLPDSTFTGSSLAAMHPLGDATWKAANGEITGTPKSAAGGWLLLDKGLQDVEMFTNFECASGCKTGLLLRATKTPDGGLKGIFISLNDGDLNSYNVTIDAQGHETNREKLAAPAGRGGPAGGGAGRGPAGAPAPGGAPPPQAGTGAPPAGGPPPGGFGRGRPATLNTGDWNALHVILAMEALRPTLNTNGMPMGITGDQGEGYGPMALYVGGTGDVHFKDIATKDLLKIYEPKEQTSAHFTEQKINDLYYGWGAAVGDINHDGILDVISGPFYYPGPDYTTRVRYRDARPYNPATEYAPNMLTFSADFTGDGWDDIVAGTTIDRGRPMDLWVNPKGESRRWQHTQVLQEIATETVLMKDIDGDGKPEIIYGNFSGYCYSRPDPANPTAPWPCHYISKGPVTQHGLGVGDINGDGRLDLVVPTGWYEQPPKDQADQLWKFHPEDFGRGGAEMGVFDFNGDGLADIITSMNAHGWGIAWFEQKRDKDGNISFVRHDIMGDYSTDNAGGATFSALHGSAFGDIDGDGIPDFITGRKMWALQEGYNIPDANGPAVLYVYRAIRDPKAPGGARFEPELIDNRSGVGDSLGLADLNKDGALDIVTATGKGTFIFFGKPGSWGKPQKKKH